MVSQTLQNQSCTQSLVKQREHFSPLFNPLLFLASERTVGSLALQTFRRLATSLCWSLPSGRLGSRPVREQAVLLLSALPSERVSSKLPSLNKDQISWGNCRPGGSSALQGDHFILCLHYSREDIEKPRKWAGVLQAPQKYDWRAFPMPRSPVDACDCMLTLSQD